MHSATGATRGTCCHQLSSSERSACTLYAVTQSLTASKTGLAWHPDAELVVPSLAAAMDMDAVVAAGGLV